jgi:hypothetical protein
MTDKKYLRRQYTQKNRAIRFPVKDNIAAREPLPAGLRREFTGQIIRAIIL